MRLKMPADFATSRAALAVIGVALIIQPSAASHRAHGYRHIGGKSPAAVMSPQVRHDRPDYNDPSKFGGEAAASPSLPSAAEVSSAAAVHVQPRGSSFSPNSDEERLVQQRVTDFNETQRRQEESFDRKLVICRGC
jgi:hypothetical protein